MFQVDQRKAQAAVELAVFGAILIFILGAIVSTATGNGYSQNQNFKSMRMAMLASWNGAKAGNLSRNSASVLFIEDRLTTDFNKYGGLERTPSIAQGSGTFSFLLEYPLDGPEVANNLPIMDIYINGQHFPFTMASYVKNMMLIRPSCPAGGPYTPPDIGGALTQGQCLQNQCLRNAREWVGGIVKESEFETVVSPSGPITPATDIAIAAETKSIFDDLYKAGLIANPAGSDLTVVGVGAGNNSGRTANVTSLVTSSDFISAYEGSFSDLSLDDGQFAYIESILKSHKNQYKLFYTAIPNGTSKFFTSPPVCPDPNGYDNTKKQPMCQDAALSSTLPTVDAGGAPFTNSNGDMQYDLLRNGKYADVDAAFPPGGILRNTIAWQWAATAGTVQGDTSKGKNVMISLDPENAQYPSYDIDGRLKEVTIYAMSQDPATNLPILSYEDNNGGDIDGGWDVNSCGPKPGLQNDSQIFTFTQDGTFLKIKEGKVYNPETDQFVRSVNQRDNVDIIQRSIQLSNNTGRFCDPSDPSGAPLLTVGNDGVTPNPVEVCIPPHSTGNCFSSQQNIKSTCYDEKDNIIFVRSRIKDTRGHFWMTDTTGQMDIK